MVATVTKKKTPPPPQDEHLLDVDLQPAGARRRVGRVERRVGEAVRQMRKDGSLRPVDVPLVGAELALAESIDVAASRKRPGWEYAVQGSARELLKVHQALAGNADADVDEDLKGLLGDLAKPS